MSLLRSIVKPLISGTISSIVKTGGVVTVPDPIAHWPLNEDAGITTASDISGSGFNGTYVGDPPRVADGTRGQVIDFQPPGDYADFGDIFYMDTFSAVCWIITDNTISKSIFLKTNTGVTHSNAEFRVRTLAGPRIQHTAFGTGGTSVLSISGVTNLSIGTWYHVAVSQGGNGNIGYLYLNGNLEGSATQTGATLNTTSSFQIGARNSNSDGTYWDGKIHDLRIYNVALTEAQIKKLYNDTI